MWNEDKQKRFDELRIGKAQGTLSEAERAELETLFDKLEVARLPLLFGSHKEEVWRLPLLVKNFCPDVLGISQTGIDLEKKG